MAQQDYYDIVEVIGQKPVQLTIGRNADHDIRHRLDVTYSYAGSTRRRVWLTRTQLEMVHTLLDAFLYGNEAQDEGVAESDRATASGTEEPPF